MINPTRLYRNVRLGIKTLMLHKLRSALTLLGVVFGVGAVIAMLAVGEGASRETLERIRKLGSNNIIISSQKQAEEASGGSANIRMSIYGLTYEDFRRIQTSYDHVSAAVPAKVIRKEGRLGSRTLDLRLVGTTPQWFDLLERDMLAGRPLLESDDASANSIVLTEHGARRLLATRGTIGQTLRIGGGYFEVVGIVRSEAGSGGDLQTPDSDVDAYLPIQVAMERFGDVNVRREAGSRSRELVELHQIIVQVDELDNVLPTSQALTRMLENSHPRGDFAISVPLNLIRQAEATRRTFNAVLGSIAGISLLVGGIGIMNIMLASVTERTREIGVRRAIGAKRAQIIGQFLIETIVLSTTGGLVGVGIGVLIPWIIAATTDMPTVVTPWSVVLSVGISAGVGIVFGIYPAMRAAKLDPIVALRHD
ncbi:MAG: ABC transporter substrate-binding protein [Phycisphaeraceae bacterium]|nr:MAG: ABC transporter substrate-binding protein [Phycisphaeraceae bacterium]